MKTKETPPEIVVRDSSGNPVPVTTSVRVQEDAEGVFLIEVTINTGAHP